MLNPVEVRNLTKTYLVKEGALFRRASREVLAVRDVSFSISQGEILGLLGPNGAGKTTTIKMLCTLIEPTAGDAFVNGYSVVKEPQKVRSSIGVMLTGERALYWKLTAKENLEYFAALYHLTKKESGERIPKLLGDVGLGERADTLVENFSTGMRIRLSYAKALLHDAPVLLFDEPTSGLDPQTARLIREAILELKRRGRSILLTTHNMEEADLLSDRVAIIDHGKIIALDKPGVLKRGGSASEIVEVEVKDMRSDTVSSLKSLKEVLEATVLVDDPESLKGVIRLRVAKGGTVLQSVLEALAKQKVSVTRLSLVESSLEDVFIELTGRALRD